MSSCVSSPLTSQNHGPTSSSTSPTLSLSPSFPLISPHLPSPLLARQTKRRGGSKEPKSPVQVSPSTSGHLMTFPLRSSMTLTSLHSFDTKKEGLFLSLSFSFLCLIQMKITSKNKLSFMCVSLTQTKYQKLNSFFFLVKN
jgi:hypothetical protein